MAEATSIFIIEDEILIQHLIRELLEDDGNYNVLGSHHDGLDGWEVCKKLKPDLLILDLRLPSLNGMEILKKARKELLDTKVLLFSSAFQAYQIKQALVLDAEGIIEKTVPLEDMKQALADIAAGELYYGPKIREMMRYMIDHPVPDSEGEILSATERQVLQLVAEGCSSKDISERLKIAPKTADTHRNRIMQKLNVKGVAGLTRYAVAKGIVQAESN